MGDAPPLADDEIRLIALCVASDAIDKEGGWQLFLHYDVGERDRRRVMHEVACISQELWDRAHTPVTDAETQTTERQ